MSRQSRGGSRYHGPSDSFTISAAVPASAISEDSGARNANDRSMNSDQLVTYSFALGGYFSAKRISEGFSHTQSP